MQLSDLPELDWLDDVGDATVERDILTMQAAPRTDWFNDPAGPTRVANAPALVCRVSGDFQLEATINVDFAATFDAGVLFVHQTAEDWAKLCFERDPTGQPMVVTVVTRGSPTTQTNQRSSGTPFVCASLASGPPSPFTTSGMVRTERRRGCSLGSLRCAALRCRCVSGSSRSRRPEPDVRRGSATSSSPQPRCSILAMVPRAGGPAQRR